MSADRESLVVEPFEKRREARKARAAQLEKDGCARTRAFVMALEEAWETEVNENERLWDQADEILQLKAEILRLRSILLPFAQARLTPTGRDGDVIGMYVVRGAVRAACREFA